jgi:hypothetical protein
MVVNRSFEPPDLAVATIEGVLTSRDQEDVVGWIRALIPQVGPLRLLIHLEAFGGWKPNGAFDSASSWLNDDEGVSKIAFVGRVEWKQTVLNLVAQPLRGLPIRYFASDRAARHWLKQSQRQTPASASGTTAAKTSATRK